jgi:hypothetical protein
MEPGTIVRIREKVTKENPKPLMRVCKACNSAGNDNGKGRSFRVFDEGYVCVNCGVTFELIEDGTREVPYE